MHRHSRCAIYREHKRSSLEGLAGAGIARGHEGGGVSFRTVLSFSSACRGGPGTRRKRNPAGLPRSCDLFPATPVSLAISQARARDATGHRVKTPAGLPRLPDFCSATPVSLANSQALAGGWPARDFFPATPVSLANCWRGHGAPRKYLQGTVSSFSSAGAARNTH